MDWRGAPFPEPWKAVLRMRAAPVAYAAFDGSGSRARTSRVDGPRRLRICGSSLGFGQSQDTRPAHAVVGRLGADAQLVVYLPDSVEIVGDVFRGAFGGAAVDEPGQRDL